MEDKRKRKKMPSAPIKSPSGNGQGFGKLGLNNGGPMPGNWAPQAGYNNAGIIAAFMRGYRG